MRNFDRVCLTLIQFIFTAFKVAIISVDSD